MGIIEFKDVCFKYSEESKVNVVDKLNIQINEGEYVCILGKNGGGKSTFARLINGLLIPQSGSVTVYGDDTSDEKKIFEIRKKVGMVFQNPDNQMVATMVEDDIAFGPENIGVPSEEIGERIDFALDSTNMQKYRNYQGNKLSGGQKQRIAIAGVLAIKPNILILDESTSMLDPKGRQEVLKVIKKLNNDGMTIISITHYMDEAFDASRVVVINDGKIKKEGTPKEIFTNEQELKSFGLVLPRSIEIRNKLIERGIKISKDILTSDELAEELCKLVQKA